MGRQCGGNLRKLERFCKPKIQEFSMILLSLSEEREELRGLDCRPERETIGGSEVTLGIIMTRHI